MLIGWIAGLRTTAPVQIRDGRKAGAIQATASDRARPATRLGHVIDRDGAAGERGGHADAPDGKRTASVVSCAKRLLNNAVGPFRALTYVARSNQSGLTLPVPRLLARHQREGCKCVAPYWWILSSTLRSEANTSTLPTAGERSIWRSLGTRSLPTLPARNPLLWICAQLTGKRLPTCPAAGSLSVARSSIALPAACDHATGDISARRPVARPNLIEPPASRQGAAMAEFLAALLSSNSSRFAAARSPYRQSRLCHRTP